MEMTYGGAMVLPRNYVIMDEEEMTYLEGGDAGYIYVTMDRSFLIGLAGLAVGIVTLAALSLAAVTEGIATGAAVAIAGFVASAITSRLLSKNKYEGWVYFNQHYTLLWLLSGCDNKLTLSLS